VSSGLLKPSPYVEIAVDSKPPRRTDTCKSTYQPKWNDPITLLVTPYSKIHFRLYDHSTFKKDSLLGENTLDLYSVLKTRDGKCNNASVSVDLMFDGKNTTGMNGHSNTHKIGELVVVLDGLNVDMKAVPAASAPVVSVVASPFPPEEPSSAASASGAAAASSRLNGGSSSSKQRRRTTGDSADKLPPLATTHQTRSSSSTTSLLAGGKFNLHNNYKIRTPDQYIEYTTTTVGSGRDHFPLLSPEDSPYNGSPSQTPTFTAQLPRGLNGLVPQPRRLLLPPIHLG
jgi:hypothetical protein